MVTTAISNHAQLSHALSKIEDDAGGAANIKAKDQVRIQGATEDFATGEIIYEAEINHNKAWSLATTAKNFPPAAKLLHNAVEKHEKKVDNWDVFKGLAKNQLADQLQKATHHNHTDEQLNRLVDSAFSKIADHKNFKEHDVRYGALKEFEAQIISLVQDAVANPAKFEEALSRFSSNNALSFDNSMYGAREDYLPTNTKSVASQHYETMDGLGPQPGDVADGDNYEALNDLPAFTPGTSPQAPGLHRAMLMERALISDTEGEAVYNRIDRSPSPAFGGATSFVDNSDQYGTLNTRSAEQNSGANSSVQSDPDEHVYETVNPNPSVRVAEATVGNEYGVLESEADWEDIYQNHDPNRPPRAYQS